jgi:hypothetical protein
MQHSVLSTSDPRWSEVLSSCEHDFYHLPRYVELEAKRECGQGLGIIVQEGDKLAFFPLLVRELPEEYRAVAPGVRDATSPYGYPCPIFSKGCARDVKFVVSSFEELQRVLREMSIVTVFFRLHPLIPFERVHRLDAGIATVDHCSTVWIDLRKPREQVLRETRATHRNLITRTKREGFVAYEDTALKHLETFGRIYRETMTRLGAAPMYLFSDSYFREMAEALGDHFHLWVVEKNSEVAAAGLFPTCGGIVQYHLSGTDAKHEKASPTRLMISEVRDWAVAAGCRTFHLGGGLGSREDGLYRFKAGFSNDKSVFRTMRVTAMPSASQLLADRWQQLSGQKSEEIVGFFPIYRKPIPRTLHR